MSLFHRYWWYGVIIAIAQIFSDYPVLVRCLGGTWVSWIVENALNIVMRSGVYSLLSFCNGSCQCVNNFIGFSGKTLFQLSFIILFIFDGSNFISFIINCCFFVCSSPYQRMSANKWRKSNLELFCCVSHSEKFSENIAKRPSTQINAVYRRLTPSTLD